MAGPVIDVIVPTMWRPERLGRVAANVHEATDAAHVVTFVAEADDSATITAAEALAAADPAVRLITNDRARNYAGACNAAVASSTAEWWFGGADDLNFHQGWDTEALAGAEDALRVVGTNDLLNPYVLSGEHATHYLVHRSYVAEAGGTPDCGPGVAMWEGYDHQYTDTEFVAVARARGEFRPCLDSVVEHLHFGNGKAPMDATYEHGQRHVGADRALFEARRHLWEHQ